MNIIEGAKVGNILYHNYRGYEIVLDPYFPIGKAFFTSGTDPFYPKLDECKNVSCNPIDFEAVKLWIDNAEKEKLRFQYNKEFHDKLEGLLDV